MYDGIENAKHAGCPHQTTRQQPAKPSEPLVYSPALSDDNILDSDTIRIGDAEEV